MLATDDNRERAFTPACPLGNTSFVVGVVLVVSAAACGDHDAPKADPEESSWLTLVELEDWTALERADDPFDVDGQAAPACRGGGFRVEDEQSWLEIDTGQCSWVTVSAPARYAVSKGQPLQLELSHYDLGAAEPARAELGLTLEGCEAFSKTIPIPSEANVYMEHFSSPCALASGGAVLFHLHNHGQNTYQLRSLSVLR
jgi:hypothetical protein